MPDAPRHIRVDLASQTLRLLEGDRELRTYRVSTGLRGPGEQMGSGCTPRGLHRVRLRIGGGCPEGAVFGARRRAVHRVSREAGAAGIERTHLYRKLKELSIKTKQDM